SASSNETSTRSPPTTGVIRRLSAACATTANTSAAPTAPRAARRAVEHIMINTAGSIPQGERHARPPEGESLAKACIALIGSGDAAEIAQVPDHAHLVGDESRHAGAEVDGRQRVGRRHTCNGQQKSNQHRLKPHRVYRRNVPRKAFANGDTLTSPALRLKPLVRPLLLASRISVRPRPGTVITIDDDAVPSPNCQTM